MGKRKSAAKPMPKRKPEKLATVFSCPFCNHDNSVECRMNRKAQIGEASCRICQEKFSTPIDSLSDPIDVYSDWIDECERVNGGAEQEEAWEEDAMWCMLYKKYQLGFCMELNVALNIIVHNLHVYLVLVIQRLPGFNFLCLHIRQSVNWMEWFSLSLDLSTFLFQKIRVWASQLEVFD